jgi:phage terminase large subunit-like protein
VYILNLWRGQVETDAWVEHVIGFIKHYKPLFLIPEDDNIFKAVAPFLKKRMRDANALCAIESMPHGSKAKVIRAQSFQGIAGMGLVHLPKDNALAEVLLDQLLKFDAGKYDDGVDACSAFGRFIDRVWEQKPPEPKKPDPTITHIPLTMADMWQERKNEW